MCAKHYHRIYRTGTLALSNPQRPTRETCIVDGCTKLDQGADRLCGKHHSRKLRNGDPELLRGPHIMVGPENPTWRGDQAGYVAAHDRVRRAYGSAKLHDCTDCGRRAAHWSYNHTDENASFHNDLPFSGDPHHYSPRCVQCHKVFDLAHLASAISVGR